MDDTTTLASELLDKLAELNQKVCDYRQDMVHEFQRYQHRLLHNAPEHVSARVEEALAAELHNYPALSPGFALDSASADLGHSVIDRWGRRGRTGSSPPPLLPHTSGVPPNDVASGSPDRDRDREFHGLFTPSYLPLLEVMQPKKITSAPAVVSSPAVPRDNNSGNTQAPPPQLDSIPQRPEPIRHYTEETTSSVTSDDSVSRTRRSALRRSSSASMKDIQSPRRVRFDVEGEEVLPTVSPPTSPRIYELLTSPPPEQVTPLDESLDHEIFEEEASILGNSPPRPKKISSTERLKALARNSTEDTSKWTVVGDIHDDDEEEEGLVMLSSKRKSKAPVPALENGTGCHYPQVESSNDITKEIHNDQSLDEVVDDLLELTPLTSFKDKKSFSPPREALESISEVTPEEDLHRPSSDKTKPTDPALISQPHEVQNREEEDMFKFDPEEPALEIQAATNDSKYIEEEEEEVEEQTTPLADNAAEEPLVSLYSTSPAMPIAKPASLQAGSASSLSKRIGASAGSYKGKPFIIGVVRDEELLKKAEEMGDVYMFIGSVDGRSGVDPSDSFRHAPYFPTGTPRTLDRHRIADSAHKQVSNAADHGQ
ncbi:hypothetical protein F4859DRAFT_424376 [Xylaria cf. heliscus]|nr:hypothetical protein F4859DRAFT_424376 [Xylaria cf. heliscus]